MVSAHDHQNAVRFADEASRLLVDLRKELRDAGDPAALRAAGDRRSHELLVAAIAREYPFDAILSEEGRLDDRRLDAERVWVIDPLDGTREFGEAGRADWAVHVALVVAGTPRAAAVALPARGVTLATDPPPPPPPPRRGPTRLLVSRTRPTEFAVELAHALGAELVPMGSAGAKAMAVVMGEADVYAHSGGQYEWDSAAPVGVAAAAGLHTSRLDGSPLRYNQPDAWLPDLLVCRPTLAEAVIRSVRAIAADVSESPRSNA